MKKQKNSTVRQKIRLFFTGVSMGVADLIPGVSGGTIALLMGIYDELLYSIKLITDTVPKLALQGKFKQAWQTIPFGFLIPLVAGIALAIFSFVTIVSFLLDTQPVLVWSLFFGLVVGPSYVVSKRIKRWNIKYIGLLGLGFIVTFIIVDLPSVGGDASLPAVFGTGAIAITAMILPGISGSLIMVLLGQYEIVIEAVASINLPLLIAFAAGAIAGLAAFVRLLTWLLKHYYFAVIATLVGIMLGSLRRIWPWQQESAGSITYSLPSIDITFLLAVVLAIIGLLIVFLLERSGIAKEHQDIDSPDFKKEFKEIESDSRH